LTVLPSTDKLSHVQQQAPEGARGDLTLRELGKLADSTYGTVGHILGGRTTSRDTAKRIARVLRRPVDVLFVLAVSSGEQSNGNDKAVA
jgi:hypothetical protein